VWSRPRRTRSRRRSETSRAGLTTRAAKDGPLAADPDELFHGAARQIVPWPQRSRRKHEPSYDTELVAAVLDGPQHLVPVDPAGLRASQPYVTRAGVAYYLSGAYELSGETYADHHDRANRFPLIWLAPNGQQVILTGHHRSAAAMLRGDPVWARVVGGDPAGGHRSVTAALHVGTSSPAGPALSVADATAELRAGSPATVLDDAAAAAVLDLLGTSPAHVRRALHFSHTGRIAGDASERSVSP